MTRNLLALLTATALLAGCVPDGVTEFDFQALQPPPPPVELTGDALVGSAAAGRFTVELYADRGGPHLGFNQFSVSVAESGASVTAARVTLAATSADGPADGAILEVGQPATTPDGDGFFRGSAFLLTPDTTARAFTVTVDVDPISGAAGRATFGFSARNDIWLQAPGDLLVSWVSPSRPVVGQNTFEVAVHRWSGTAFLPVSGADVQLYPYMDMGGGDGHSTPFTPPQSVGNGRYRSSVDFIMSGGWEMTVSLTLPGMARQDARFIGFTVFEP